jgi:hypothetical protein
LTDKKKKRKEEEEEEEVVVEAQDDASVPSSRLIREIQQAASNYPK